jgi:hypothetical protein
MRMVSSNEAGSVTGFYQRAAVRVPGRVIDCVTDLVAEPLCEPLLAVAR